MTPKLTNRECAERICIEANIYPRGNLANTIENALDEAEQRTLRLNKPQFEKLQASRDTAWASEQRLAAQCLRLEDRCKKLEGILDKVIEMDRCVQCDDGWIKGWPGPDPDEWYYCPACNGSGHGEIARMVKEAL